MRRIFFYSVLSFFISVSVSAEELTQRIVIAPEEQACKWDWDCAVVEVDCQRENCECSETAVNKRFLAKYQALLEECQGETKAAGKLTACDLVCQPPTIKCHDGLCQVTAK